MSQAQVLPAVSTPISLPPITYKGHPVITTEMLAKAYGCSAKNIRDNFANNRERFVEGKHFFMLTNGDLKAFRDYTENFGVVVPARTRHFTIYTERGALQHAKSIGTDETWTVYDVLVETFFRAVKPQSPTQHPTALTPSTADDRAPLRSLVTAWSQISGNPHQALWPQVKAHFRSQASPTSPHAHLPQRHVLPAASEQGSRPRPAGGRVCGALA